MDRLIKGNKAICEPSLTCPHDEALNLTELRGNLCVSDNEIHRGFRHRKCQKADILDGFPHGVTEMQKNPH